jgi:O-antigen/teichoic acid export membrane protein
VRPAEVVLSVALRLAASAAKFAIFLYLAKDLPPEEVGLIGIVFAVIAIGVQITGAELHYINSRDIAAGSKDVVAGLIKAQLRVHMISYLGVAPVLWIVFYFGLLAHKYFWIVLVLLISEHLAQELTRFLQFVFRPVLSALLIFIRSGLWVIALIFGVELFHINLSALIVLKAWAIFSILAAACGLYLIREYLLLRQQISLFTLEWVTRTLRRAAPFFTTTVFFSSSLYLDRFILDALLGKEAVGIYFFLWSLASALSVFVTFAVGVFYGPLAIRAYRQEGLGAYLKVRKVFARKTATYAGIGMFCGAILIEPVLQFIGRVEYLEYAYIFYFLLSANCVVLASDFTNLEMYVRGLDREMMFAAIFGLVVTLVIQWTFIDWWGIAGGGVGAILSVLATWCGRFYFLRRSLRIEPVLLTGFRQ